MKLNNLNIFTIFSAISQFTGGLIGPFYVLYIQKIGGSIENLGISFGILVIFQSLFSYWGGKYSDKLGRKPLLIITSFVTSILFVVYLFVQNVTQLYILQAVFGIVGAVYGTVSTAFLADITHRSKRGVQMGKYNTITGLFAGVALLISGFIVGKFGFEIVFYIVAFIGIVSTVLLFLIKETVRKKK